jgi:hypothetical protein
MLLPVQEFGSEICCPVFVGRPLWLEAGSVLCKSESSHLSVHLLFTFLCFEVRSYFTTDSQSVSQYGLVSSTLMELVTRHYFLSECCCLKFAVLFLWAALSDERTGLKFSVQSLNGPSRAEPVTILYYLIWNSPNLKARFPYLYPPGTGWSSYTPRHWVLFTSSLTTRRATVEEF